MKQTSHLGRVRDRWEDIIKRNLNKWNGRA
jgi:hypothetical protein